MIVNSQNCVKADLPTKFGQFNIMVIKEAEEEIILLIKGNVNSFNKPLVRIHSECFTGDVFHSLKCDCREQLEMAIRLIEDEGNGLVIYLHQEGRGIGLFNKIKAYQLQQDGYDTVDANLILNEAIDGRDYKIAAEVLKGLKIDEIKLITNNPDKIESMKSNGINVVERIPCEMPVNNYNKRYIKTKKDRMNHIINL